MNDEIDTIEDTVEETPEESTTTEMSVEDEVRKAYEEITGEESTSDVPDDVEEVPEQESNNQESQEVQSSETPKRGRGRPRKEPEQPVESVDPPADWDAEGKETFRELPAVAQKQIKRIADEYQKWRRQNASEQTRVVKEYQSKAEELEPALRVVRGFLPRWAAEGMTPEAALSKLAAFNELAIKDPDTALEQLAAATGRQIEIKNRQTQSQPQNNSLTQRPIDVNAEVERVINARIQQAQVQTLAQAIDDAHNSLKNEVNGLGRYSYPDFHNPQFESDLVPLVERILGSNPDLDPKEAIRRAYIASGGRYFGGNTQNGATTTRPVGTNRNNLAAARRAATSVSGSFGGNSAQIPEARPGESVEETVKRTYGYIFNR
jgi:hypothetical protein